MEFDIYGRIREDTFNNKPFIPFRQLGQYEDKELDGLYYNRFRYYNPETGSYISKDPIGLPGNNPNLYAYTHDSNTMVDPLGLMPEEKVTVFRVQEGSLTDLNNRSKDLIKIDTSGNIKIVEGTLNVSIGDTTHAEHFAALRGGDVAVYSFEIPKSTADLIESNAIPQANYRTNPLNQGKTAPKIVDPPTPGKSYELPSKWAKILEENAIEGSGKVTKPEIKCK